MWQAAKTYMEKHYTTFDDLDLSSLVCACMRCSLLCTHVCLHAPTRGYGCVWVHVLKCCLPVVLASVCPRS